MTLLNRKTLFSRCVVVAITLNFISTEPCNFQANFSN